MLCCAVVGCVVCAPFATPLQVGTWQQVGWQVFCGRPPGVLLV